MSKKTKKQNWAGWYIFLTRWRQIIIFTVCSWLLWSFNSVNFLVSLCSFISSICHLNVCIPLGFNFVPVLRLLCSSSECLVNLHGFRSPLSVPHICILSPDLHSEFQPYLLPTFLHFGIYHLFWRSSACSYYFIFISSSTVNSFLCDHSSLI